MKIRNGFVSNSSSSNFIVIGRPAVLNEIDDPHVKYLGQTVNEGQDYFRPDEDMIKWMKAYGTPRGQWGEIGELIYELNSFNEEGVLSKDNIRSILNIVETNSSFKDGVKLYFFKKDFYQTDSMDDFLRRYGET
jgi:hypothetical protein